MHEYSVVQSLITSCEENARTHSSNKVTKVIVKVGVMSGVEPDLLQTAFDTFKEKTICDGCELFINIQQVVIKCLDCEEQSILLDNAYHCHHCKSTNVNVTDGEEMYLMQLELE